MTAIFKYCEQTICLNYNLGPWKCFQIFRNCSISLQSALYVVRVSWNYGEFKLICDF